MYMKCEECETIMEEDEVLKSDNEFNQEEWYCCKCKSDDLVEIYQCKVCEEDFVDYQDEICVGCQKVLQDKANEFFKQFNEQEKEYIIDYIG